VSKIDRFTREAFANWKRIVALWCGIGADARRRPCVRPLLHGRRVHASLAQCPDQKSTLVVLRHAGGVGRQGEIAVLHVAERWILGDVSVLSRRIFEQSAVVAAHVFKRIAAGDSRYALRIVGVNRAIAIAIVVGDEARLQMGA